jgi:peptidoglycan hydrolase-like protein with peptidoglycan-binding domain
MLHRSRRAIVFIAAACLIGLAACAFVVLNQPAAPASIVSTTTAVTAPVSSESFLDSANLNLRVTALPAQKLSSQAVGLVTSDTCVAGQAMVSGTSTLSVNGTPLVSLATPAPLWRDLTLGDTGTDVTGLQKELSRLGQKTSIKGTVDASTLAAVSRLLKANGSAPNGSAANGSALSIGGTISRQLFVWLPNASVMPSQCLVQLGQPVAESDPIATVTQRVSAVTVLAIPTTTAVGPHVLLVDAAQIAVPESGIITDPAALAAIQASAAYATYLANAPSGGATAGAAGDQTSTSPLSYTYQLAAPIAVTAVPAAALYNLSGATGCLQSDGRALAATIVGSQLGKTFVTLNSGRKITHVSLKPATDKACR